MAPPMAYRRMTPSRSSPFKTCSVLSIGRNESTTPAAAAQTFSAEHSPSAMTSVTWHGRPIGPHETAGCLAAPVWATFMRRALKGMPNETLAIPEGVLPVRVNYRTGLPTDPGDPNGITEYFVRGALPEREALSLGPPSTPPHNAPPPPPPPSIWSGPRPAPQPAPTVQSVPPVPAPPRLSRPP